MKKHIYYFSRKIKKYAFLQKNLKALSFESKIIFLVHLVTMISCFFPWLSVVYTYTNEQLNYFSGFTGPTWFLGVCVFLMSLVVTLFFLDKIFDKKISFFPFFKEDIIILVASLEQIILLICVYSVLMYFGQGYETGEIRFGLTLALTSQIIGALTVYLRWKKHKKQQAMNFFNSAAKAPPPNTKK